MDKTINKKNVSIILVGLILFSFFIYFAEPQQIIDQLENSKPAYWLYGVIFCLLSVFTRALKWNILLNKVSSSHQRIMTFLPYYFFNNLISNFTPAKSGDALGPIIFRKVFSVSYGTGIAVIFVDRLIELIILLLGLFWSGLFFLPYKLSKISWSRFGLISAGLLIFFLMAGFLIFFVLNKMPVFFSFIENRFDAKTLKKLACFFKSEGDLLLKGIKSINASIIFSKIVPLTIIAWGFDVLFMYMFYQSVVRVDFIHMILVHFVCVAVTLISLVPYGIGVGEFNAYYLWMLLGYQKDGIFAGILISRFFSVTLVVTLGLVSFIIINRYKNKIFKKV
ncbi:MAG: lysylphosphatidylglycerol synthase transmembrane domain-containing protein [Desulfobacterales bacterium]|nr:lysylphosphatidylglycerol synthase transmembrane domain-containing protein [Desulfobacterales bacterium]